MLKLKVLTEEKGFSLIELLAVLVILAIIAAIAIPSIFGVINNQRDKAIISDIVQLVETSKIQMTDNECGNEICTYSPSVNEISFTSTRFTTGEVNFTNGNDPEDIIITVNVDREDFKGKNKIYFRDLISTPGGFTEKQLLEEINR